MKSYCSGELCHIRLTDKYTESDSYHKPEICHCCSGILHSRVALPNDCPPDSRPYLKPHRDPQCVGQPWSSSLQRLRDPPKPPSLLPPVIRQPRASPKLFSSTCPFYDHLIMLSSADCIDRSGKKSKVTSTHALS